MTTKERTLWQTWLNTPGGAPKEYAAFRKVEKRNLRQRELRASPEQKAKEARASRRSYWKNVAKYAEHGGAVSTCRACKAGTREVEG